MDFFITRWPARITVTARPVNQGVQADFVVTNFGFGPIQSGHVRAQLGQLLSIVEPDLADRPSDYLQELERLHALQERGALNGEEFKQAKAKILRSREARSRPL